MTHWASNKEARPKEDSYLEAIWLDAMWTLVCRNILFVGPLTLQALYLKLWQKEPVNFSKSRIRSNFSKLVCITFSKLVNKIKTLLFVVSITRNAGHKKKQNTCAASY